MIECIFTIDYEIYGNGEGNLRDLVYEPAEKLAEVFNKWDAKFVPFIEVAEIEMMDMFRADNFVEQVKQQIVNFHNEGFELGLHLHPQWYNAKFENQVWYLDNSEYNLCTLPKDRISHIIDQSLAYLRSVVGNEKFTPISFRAGNWLFQPTKIIARILAESGILIDSSVFKGGVQYKYHLNYRRSSVNGYYWKFLYDVNISNNEGILLEIPIYTVLVPFWKMIQTKRINLQTKSISSSKSADTIKLNFDKINRLRDFLRLKYPLKFDFCRMTFTELKNMMEEIISEDEINPSVYKPIVAIGHTKDLTDLESIKSFLSYLSMKNIKISTFKEVYPKCI